MLLLAAVILCLPLSADPDLVELARDLEKLMEEERQGRHGSSEILRKYPFTTFGELVLLDPYFEDASSRVRQRAVGLLGVAAISSVDPHFRHEVVHKMATILNPTPPDLCSSIARRFNSAMYSKQDFTDEVRANLTEKLLDWPPPRDAARWPCIADLVELVPKAELHGALPFIDMVESELRMKWKMDPLDRNPREVVKSLGFVCLGVRAQLGDDGAMERLRSIYKALETDFDRMDALTFIGFMRRPEVVELLRPLLNSEAIRPGPTGRTEGDVLAWPVASSAASALSRMLEGYPKPSDLEECRQWMNRRPPGFITWEFKE